MIHLSQSDSVTWSTLFGPFNFLYDLKQGLDIHADSSNFSVLFVGM